MAKLARSMPISPRVENVLICTNIQIFEPIIKPSKITGKRFGSCYVKTKLMLCFVRFRLKLARKYSFQICPAMPHDVPIQLPSAVSYIALFNLLDYAADTVSITRVTAQDEENLCNYPERDDIDRLVKETAKNSADLPVGVQIAAPLFREEMVLRVLRELEEDCPRH